MSDLSSGADASPHEDRRTAALLIFGFVLLELGAGLSYVFTDNLWLAIAIALTGVIAVALGMREVASTNALTIREMIAHTRERALADPSNAFERFSRHRIWIPLCVVAWGCLGFVAVDGVEMPMRVVSALGIGTVGGFGGALVRPRRSRMLDDWSDWTMVMLLGGLALADGISALTGNGSLTEWSMGPVSLALAAWLLGGALLDARRPIAPEELELTT